ncbi:ABC transporter substrate-binding protein [Paraclostridium bifermentans]|jgi:spermidine/putrescine transport system substrate-binding protein|uniref:ABC transporter substrate-binding protein n=1 Tax=Paraclostridium bifermentans TaxID=1490 RepID=UPI00041C3121|nr:spermidine/putrescine ABC transporter substrate-binding protein [Paraclostridium bifermentans]MBS5954813.1 spermidine/putrescine ABC transporter substrate-binding protein [Paraclostridium bifermentans]MBU5289966.1 spermidine/putrescine ABC transporter substrate-binding protein [Paraclostridium bifermentans]UAG18658.1 spermidine/putrescine ABC transporter substrate-binding protein [Paraclostridium bifermentans]GKZ05082.1 spermidine/putrescine ABC transporter substrate-binding protein [Paraclo
MKLRKISILITIGLMVSTMLTGCGATDSKKVLNVYNVGDYIDENIITLFEEKTGIDVQYETYDTNEMMYQKVKSGSTNYDLIFPSDYMVEKMKSEGLLQKIDFKNIPNMKYIDKSFLNPIYDETNEYSVPYMWGTFGILYNKKMVKEPVDSWDILWNPKYKGNIMMFDSVRDTMGISLKRLGYSMNTTNPKEINEAMKELMKQKDLVLAYVNDEGKDRLLGEEVAMGIAYSGDAVTLMEENPNLAYAIPKEGTNKWVDAMAIPKSAQNKKEAEMFINFLLDPEIAKMNAEYIGYSTPNVGALKLLDKEVTSNPVAYPPKSVMDKTETFIDLGDKLRLYDEAWIKLKSK